jgi:succinate dehydrogenase/fumarate reductase flavoprotein subunit
MEWNLSTDVVVIGAGASGLAAAVSARDHGAAVIVVEENFDIGGHAMLSGGRVHLGGGNALQKKIRYRRQSGAHLRRLGRLPARRRTL